MKALSNFTLRTNLDLALRIRREIPDMAITTDIIVGFPGETPEDVDETIDVVRRVKFRTAEEGAGGGRFFWTLSSPVSVPPTGLWGGKS